KPQARVVALIVAGNTGLVAMGGDQPLVEQRQRRAVASLGIWRLVGMAGPAREGDWASEPIVQIRLDPRRPLAGHERD
ncbi:MAG: hypothetical protein ACI9MR_005145, partial [Myxococcota bacterium]